MALPAASIGFWEPPRIPRVLAGKTGTCAAAVVVCVLTAFCGTAAARWQPPQQLTWYWQLTGTPKVEAVDATDIDGFDNSAAAVAAFHARGQRVICYIDVGTAENWRSDYGQFPASVLGSSNGWPGERWLDIRQLSVLEPIMTARFQMCAQKGFDAVEPDNIDGYENDTGFPLTASDQLAYNEWVANEVHSLGMAVFQKNDPDQAARLQPDFDGVIDEQCNQYSECDSFRPYLAAGKPVLNAEYQSSLYPGFCTADGKARIMGALYSV
ncbi:MAG: endo alpha-1,4 polygalactosaminidase, partial [Solirubrobacteraceae bacterium]